MKMDKNTRSLLLAVGLFGVAVGADVASKAIYTRTKIGPDRKAFMIASGISIASIYLMFTTLKYGGDVV